MSCRSTLVISCAESYRSNLKVPSAEIEGRNRSSARAESTMTTSGLWKYEPIPGIDLLITDQNFMNVVGVCWLTTKKITKNLENVSDPLSIVYISVQHIRVFVYVIRKRQLEIAVSLP